MTLAKFEAAAAAVTRVENASAAAFVTRAKEEVAVVDMS